MKHHVEPAIQGQTSFVQYWVSLLWKGTFKELFLLYHHAFFSLFELFGDGAADGALESVDNGLF